MSALMTGKLIDLIYKYISIYFMAVGMNLRLLVRSKSHLAFKDIHALSIIVVLQKRKKSQETTSIPLNSVIIVPSHKTQAILDICRQHVELKERFFTIKEAAKYLHFLIGNYTYKYWA